MLYENGGQGAFANVDHDDCGDGDVDVSNIMIYDMMINHAWDVEKPLLNMMMMMTLIMIMIITVMMLRRSPEM